MRRCAGCMTSFPKKDLIRIVHNGDDEYMLDISGKAQGRGVYLCRDVKCFAAARKKNALSRSLGTTIPKETLDRLFEELAGYADGTDQ